MNGACIFVHLPQMRNKIPFDKDPFASTNCFNPPVWIGSSKNIFLEIRKEDIKKEFLPRFLNRGYEFPIWCEEMLDDRETNMEKSEDELSELNNLYEINEKLYSSFIEDEMYGVGDLCQGVVYRLLGC
jgi:hypothetical protein